MSRKETAPMKTHHDDIKNHASIVKNSEQRVNDGIPDESTGGAVAADAQAPELQPDRSTAILDALYENMRRHGRDAALLDAAACIGAALRFELSIEGSEAAFYLL